MIGKEKPKENQLLQQFDKFLGELGTKNLEELAPYTQQIKIDGNFLYYRDYLGIRDDPKIMQYLKLEKNIQKSIIQRCFSKQKLHSQNMGWLQIFKKKMFQGDWQEVFVILTNVGLVLFKKPGDAEPILFVSFVQAVVIKNPLFNTSKQNTIKIRYENCDSEFVFNVVDQLENHNYTNKLG